MISKHFLNQLDSVPIWTQENNQYICRDLKTNKILHVCQLPTLPDGNPIQIFQPYPAILIQSIDVYRLPNYISSTDIEKTDTDEFEDLIYTIKPNTSVFVATLPNGTFFLSLKPERCPNIGDEIPIHSFSFSSIKIKI